MPRFGTMDLTQWGVPAEIHGYGTEPWVLRNAQVLNVAFEIEDLKASVLLPPALGLTIPAYATFNIASFPESPVGGFSIAEVRVVGRAGFRPRAFVLRSIVDNQAARLELAQRWGYPVAAGEVSLHLRHDRIRGRVRVGGSTVLECELIDRDVISGSDIQWVASVHLARNQDDGKLVLVQVDPEYVFATAERGRPRVPILDKQVWNCADYLELTNPISASFAKCDVTLPKIRYVVDPERPALQGTTKVAA